MGLSTEPKQQTEGSWLTIRCFSITGQADTATMAPIPTAQEGLQRAAIAPESWGLLSIRAKFLLATGCPVRLYLPIIL